jgi:hypothetical protein
MVAYQKRSKWHCLNIKNGNNEVIIVTINLSYLDEILHANRHV